MRLPESLMFLLLTCALSTPLLAHEQLSSVNTQDSLQPSQELLAALRRVGDDVHAIRTGMELSWSLLTGLLQLQQGQQLLAAAQEAAPTPVAKGKQATATLEHAPAASPRPRRLQSLHDVVTALCGSKDGDNNPGAAATDSLCEQMVSNLDPVLLWQQCGGDGASCGAPGYGPCMDAEWADTGCSANTVCTRVNQHWWSCLPTTTPTSGSVSASTAAPPACPCASPSPAPTPGKQQSPTPTPRTSPTPQQPSPSPAPAPHPRSPPAQSSPRLPSPSSPMQSPQPPPTVSPQPSPHLSAPPGFVQAVGTRFFLNGQPWYFQGSNIYGLAVESVVASKDTVEGVVKELASLGLRVLRFWGFGHGWDDMTVDQTGNWTLNAAALDRLDFTVACAAKYGMRVVFPFVNYEPDLTGINFWVNWTLGPGIEKERFYADSLVFSRYVGYAKSIILRTNQYTGRMHRDEPAILAWELMNEPHTVNGMELWASTSYVYGDEGVLIGKGQPVGKLVQQWLCRAAAEIKQMDPYHMVTTGEEGYRAYGPKVPYNWLNNGLKGVDFEANLKCPYTDYHTIHTYPDNWNIPFTQFIWVIDNFMKDRAALAFAAGKPIVMGEYGCCKAADYQGHRTEVYQALHKAADDIGFAGCIVWQGFPWRQGLGVDGVYDVVLTEDSGQEIVKHAAVTNARNS